MRGPRSILLCASATCVRLLVLLLVASSGGLLQAAELASLQRGSAVSTGNGTVTVSLGQAVDPSRSVLFFSTRHNSARPPGSMLRGRLAGASTLTFERVSNENSTIDIEWTVAEFSSGVSVQRGSFDVTSTTHNISLTQPVADVSQAFVLWSKTPATTDTVYSQDDPVGAYLLNTNTVRFQVENANSNHIVDYQVVEYTNPGELFVQTGVNSFSSGATTLTVNVPTSVATSSSLLLAGYTSNGTGSEIARRMINAELVSSSQVRFSRERTGSGMRDVIWQLIEFRDGTLVQQDLESFSNGEAVRVVNLATTVDPASSVAFSGVQPVGGLNLGSSSYQSDDILGTGAFGFDLAADTLTLRRNNVSGDGSVGWNVVSFGADVSPVAVLDVRMDELTWTGSPGEVVDTASGLNGTAFGGVTTEAADPALVGNPGTCRYGNFDGSNDYVAIPHDPALNGSGALVYAAWVNPRGWSGVRQIMAKSVHGGGSGRAQMGLFSESGVLKVRAETVGGRREATATLPALDRWTHVTGVFTGTELRLYLDGVLAGSNSFAATTLRQTTDDLNISKRVGTSQYFFDGFIDEVRVYTEVLDDAAVAELMTLTHPCPNAPLGQWHLDEFGWNGTAGEVVDYSGNDFDGTAFNTVTRVGLVCNAADMRANGTSDYLSLDNTPWDGLDDFTIAAWYRGVQTGEMAIVSGARVGQLDELVFYFSSTDRFTPYLNGGGGGSINAPGLTDGNWHFVVWTREGTANCLYLDDVLQGCTTLSLGTVNIDPGGLIVGQEQNSLGGGFVSFQDIEADLDELLLFDEALSQTELAQIRANNLAGFNWDGSERVCPVTGAAGFVLNHDGAGIHCLDEPVAVTAVDGASAVVQSYANEITLQTATARGSWSLNSGSGLLNDAVPDDGRATYTFDLADNGSATFNLSYPEGDALVDVDVFQSDDITIRDNEAEGILTFAPTGFTLTQNLLPNPPPSPINDPLQAQLAGAGFPLHITAYGVTDDDPQCGVIESYGGLRNLKFSMSYENPGTGTRLATVDGQDVALNPAVASTQGVIFTAGQAQVGVIYKDAGEIRLRVDDDGSFPAALTGSTNPFVVRPAELRVTRVEGSAGETNPGSASMSDPLRFVAAGAAFEVDVTALDVDGVATPNFGRETPAERVAVRSPGLVQPSGGRNGSGDDVTNGASFSTPGSGGTQSNSSIFFDETGIITLEPFLLDGDYLGAGDLTRVVSGNVGRFYPARFELVSDSVSPACGDFSYMSEPAISVQYRLQAQTVAGAVTQNYNEVDFAVPVPVAAVSVVAESGDDGVDRGARLSALGGVWDDGERVINRSDVSFARSAAPDGPFADLQLGLRVTDPLDPVPLAGLDMNPATIGDCVLAGDCDSRALGAAGRLVYGRLLVLPSFGPEDLDLDVGLEAQLYTGSAFQQNFNDNCSLYNAALGSLANFSGNLASTETALIAPVVDESLSFGAADPTAPLTLSAPGVGNEGAVDVQLDVPAWLEFNWLGSGDQDPVGPATFGRFRGHDRIIFWRETN